MKDQINISIFLALLTLSSSIFLKNTIHSKYSSDRNFIDTKTIETCDEGIAIQIDNTNLFRDRINYSLPRTTIASNVAALRELPIFTKMITLGENGLYLARLRINLVIPGVYLETGSNDQHWMRFRLFLDTTEIGYYFFQQFSNGALYMDVKINTTVYNIAPGFYKLSLQAMNKSNMRFGNFNLNFAYIDLEGEYATNPRLASSVKTDFLLPVDFKPLPRIKTRVIANADNTITSMDINGVPVTVSSFSSDLSNRGLASSFPVLLSEGDEIVVRASNGTGQRGLRVSLSYYNNLGLPVYANSSTNWICNSLANMSQHTANVAANISDTFNLKPLDFTSSYIWGNGGNSSSAECKSLLSSSNTTPSLYFQAATKASEIKINDKAIAFKTQFDLPEIVKNLTPATLEKTLVSGDKIEFFISRANVSSNNKAYKTNANLSTDLAYYKNSFLIAIIFYKDKSGKFNVVDTNNKSLWQCKTTAVSHASMSDTYRDDFFLTNAFGVRPIYLNNTDQNYSCVITLP